MHAAEACDLVVVCYDIADNRRRYRLARALEGYGLRVQESVFECWLTPAQVHALRARLLKLLQPTEDRIAYYTLRPIDRDSFRALGLHPSLSQDFSSIVL